MLIREYIYTCVIVHVSGFFYIFAAPGLRYDVLLLHADSVVTNEFGRFVRRELTELSKLPYDVFHYSDDDMLFGESMTNKSSV